MNQIPIPPIIISDLSCKTLSTDGLYSDVFATNIVTSESLDTIIIYSDSMQVVNNRFIDVGTINDIVIETHGNRHGFNDEDPLIVGTISDIKNISDTGSSSGISHKIPRADHVHFHGHLSGGTLHENVTAGSNGFMSSEDKNRLDGISSNTNPEDVGNLSSAGTNNTYSRSDHVHFHGYLSGGNLHAAATELSSGFMTPSDLSITNEMNWEQSRNEMVLNDIFSAEFQPFGSVSAMTQQIIPSYVDTLVDTHWDQSSVFLNIEYGNGYFTIIYPGYYTILSNICISTNTNGFRSGYIYITSGNTSRKSGEMKLNYELDTSITPTIWLNSVEYLYSGDRISLYVRQNSGSSVNTIDIGSYFTIYKIM